MPRTNIFSKIERHFAVPSLPVPYREMVRRGYLDVTSDAYMAPGDSEWVPPAELATYKWNDYQKPKPGLVPFAKTGMNDLWCWDFERMSACGEPAIALCGNADSTGEWRAPSLAAWFYRSALEKVSWWELSDRATRRLLRAWTPLVREFGEGDWADDLAELLKRRQFEFETGGRRKRRIKGLLTERDVRYRVGYAFGKEYDGNSFNWEQAV